MVQLNPCTLRSLLHPVNFEGCLSYINDKVYEICRETFLSWQEPSRKVELLGIVTIGFTLAVYKLHQIFLKKKPPNDHEISLPGALHYVAGHRYDPSDNKSRFAYLNSNSDFTFAVPTKLETRQLRSLLMNLLKNRLKKTNFIIKTTREWAKNFNKSPSHQRFFKMNSDLEEHRLIYKMENKSVKVFTQRDEAGRFFLGLLWKLFIGKEEAPEYFKQGSANISEKHSFEISQLHFLKRAFENSNLDESIAPKMLSELELPMNAWTSVFCTSLYVLFSKPDIQNQVYLELKKSINLGETLANAARKNKLLLKIVAESLRVVHSAPIIRKNARNKFVMENPNPSQKKVIVKPGDNVVINFHKMAHNPDVVGPKPLEIDLERACLVNLTNLKRAAWKPFGDGVHSCPAARAIQKLCPIVLATLIYDFEICKEDNTITINPRKGLD